MIFAVAGTQLPFHRLMTALDNVAARRGVEIVAQTADQDFVPHTITSVPFMTPREFEAHVARCSMIVAHAGMGIIIAAAKHRKPLILMPRKAILGEHRNDHQLATVDRFQGMAGLQVASTEEELEEAVCSPALIGFDIAPSPRRQGLIDALRLAIA